ncbi:MAG: type II secretion system protein GspM [Thiopseudomonas sp.]
MLRDLWAYKRDGVISLGILLVVLLVVVLLVLEPFFAQSQRYRAELRRDSRALLELRAIDQVRDDLRGLVGQFAQDSFKNWIFSENRADRVSLEIQRLVSEILSSQGAEVRSISALRTVESDEYLKAGVEVNFISDLPALMGVLRSLENNKPLLVLDELRMDPFDYRRSAAEVMPQKVNVHLMVHSFLAADAELEP